MKDGNKPGCLEKIYANRTTCLEDMAVERFNTGYLGTSHVTLTVSNDVITSQINNSNNIYAGVYIYKNTNQVYYLCGNRNTPELCIAIFRNQSRDCQIKKAAPMTVSLKHFKACIFQTFGAIFMKFLPSITVSKKILAKVTLMFCVRF